jgi:peroxiredoxin
VGCRPRLAHERSLVTRLEGKPFIMLGIHTPIEPGGLRKLIDEGEVTWPVWFDEFGDAEGPGPRFAKEWRPEYRPRTYVIDHKGIIRHKGLRDKELDQAVDRLLEELEREKGS